MKISIIIVNWQTKDLLKKCLESITRFGKNIDYELIVVDNASIDGSVETIKQLNNLAIKQFKFILNEKNLGFARAVNQAIKYAITNNQEPITNSYFLLLNPDTEVQEKTLEKMIEFMDTHQDCGILSGKILNPDGTIQASIRKFPDLLSQIFVLLKCHHFFKNLLPIKKYFALDFDYSKTQKVDQAMGSFLMIRKEVIDKIGLFDERFFLWFEEVDFCKRTKDIGRQIYYYPEAEVTHQKAASFSQILPFKNQCQFNKSLLYYFKKHHSFFSWLILLLLQPISLFLSLVVSFFPGIKKFKKL